MGAEWDILNGVQSSVYLTARVILEADLPGYSRIIAVL
jgi:hypothetical protein